MASEISCQDVASTGLTVYFRLRNAAQEIWDTTGTPAFVTYVAGNIANYDIAMTEQGASGYFVGSLPAIPAGIYHITAHVQAGGSPAEGDTELAVGDIVWDGSALVQPIGAATAGRLAYRAAKVWYVSTDGDDGNSGLTPELAFLTPQAAHDAAAADDTIVILAGTYTMAGGPPGLAITKDLTIYGQGQATRLVVSGATAGLTITNCNCELNDLLVDAYEPIRFNGSGSNVKRLGLNNVVTANAEFGGAGSIDGLIVAADNTSVLTVVARDCWIRSAYDGVIANVAAGATARIELYNCTIRADINAIAGVGATGTVSLLACNCWMYGDTVGVVFGGAAATQTIELVDCALSSGSSGLDVDASGATGAGVGGVTLSDCRYRTDKTSGTVTIRPIPDHLSPATYGRSIAVDSSGQVTVGAMAAGTVTAAAIATGAIDSDAIAASAVTAIQSGLATASALTTVGSNVTAVKAKTDSLTFTVSSVLDVNIQYINDVLITGNGVSPTKFGV